MSKRRTADEVTRLLKVADRDLAKGLTVSDFCRKVGVAQTTYHRLASAARRALRLGFHLV
jgi:hypothetical protein